jgi:hypothetical protein
VLCFLTGGNDDFLRTIINICQLATSSFIAPCPLFIGGVVVLAVVAAGRVPLVSAAGPAGWCRSRIKNEIFQLERR